MMQTIEFDSEIYTERRAALLPASALAGGDASDLLEAAGFDPGDVEDVLDLVSKKGVPAGEALLLVEERAYAHLRGRVEIDDAVIRGPRYAPIDTSPEATARRIVGFATKFLDGFAEGRGGLDEGVLDEYMAIIEGAIDEGFSQARAILEGIGGGEVPDEIDRSVDRTYDLVKEYLAEWREKTLERIRGGASSPASDEEEVPA